MISLRCKGWQEGRGGYVFNYIHPTDKKPKTLCVVPCTEDNEENKAKAIETAKVALAEVVKRFQENPADFSIMRLSLEYAKHKPRLQERTSRYYRQVCERFNKFVGAKPIKELKKIDLTSWLASMDVSDGQRRKCGRIVMTVVKFFADMDAIDKDPFRGFKLPKGRKRGPECMLTDAELKTFLEWNDKTLADITATIAGTGCRPGEVCGLKGSMVNLTTGIITLGHHKTASKGGSPRRPILDHIKPLLAARLALYGTGHLFPQAHGKPYDTNLFGHHFKERRKELGLPSCRVAHGLRHRFCLTMKRLGLSADECARLLGHADSQMVKTVYGHDEELFGETASKLQRLASLASK